jgi:alkylation response protein AidB-like acyl-CoA dehydrogenase
MEFGWNDEQQQGYESARRLGQELGPPPEPGTREAWRARWQRCADFGVQALNVPVAYCGLGLGVRSAVRALEGLGAGCGDNGLLMGLGAQVWSVHEPLREFGNQAQQQRWLPALARGGAIGAFALTEPGAGSDIFHLQTRAEADGDGYRLQGEKAFVTNAPVADLFLVIAATRPQGGYFGLTAFLLPRDSPGLEVGVELRKMGLESSPMAGVRLDGVWAPREAVLGEWNGGGAVVMHTLEWERGCLLVPALGTMDRLLQATTEYTRLRKQFGRPVIEFEAVGALLAEVRLRLELSRLLAYEFAWMKDQGLGAGLQASMVKLYLSESLRRTAEIALHLHGAYGYMRELEFERVWRDAMASSLYSGTTVMQQNLIAESLLRAPAQREEAAG